MRLIRISAVLGFTIALSGLLTGCGKNNQAAAGADGAQLGANIPAQSVGDASEAGQLQLAGAQEQAQPRSFNLFPGSGNTEAETPDAGSENTGGLFGGLFKKREGGQSETEQTGGLFSGLKNAFSGGASSLPQFGGLGGDGCDQQIAHAKQSGSNHMLISFEGLGSKQMGFVRNNIVKRAHGDVNSGWVSKSYGWQDASAASECAQRFHLETGGKISVVGHSFGGGIATFKFADQLNQSGVPIENAVTLDPRNMGNDTNYAMTRNFNQYQKPPNVNNFTNFYQNSGLRGYGVEGANNINLQSSHVGLAREEQVYTHVRGLLSN